MSFFDFKRKPFQVKFHMHIFAPVKKLPYDAWNEFYNSKRVDVLENFLNVTEVQ